MPASIWKSLFRPMPCAEHAIPAKPWVWVSVQRHRDVVPAKRRFVVPEVWESEKSIGCKLRRRVAHPCDTVTVQRRCYWDFDALGISMPCKKTDVLGQTLTGVVIAGEPRKPPRRTNFFFNGCRADSPTGGSFRRMRALPYVSDRHVACNRAVRETISLSITVGTSLHGDCHPRAGVWRRKT